MLSGRNIQKEKTASPEGTFYAKFNTLLSRFKSGDTGQTFWYSIGNMLREYPDLAAKVYPLVATGFEKGAYEHWTFWETINTLLKDMPELGRELYPIFVRGFEKGAHKHREFWESINRLLQSDPQSISKIKPILIEGFEHVKNSDWKREEFWRAVNQALQNDPELASDILLPLVEKGAYKQQDFWSSVNTVIRTHSDIGYSLLKTLFEKRIPVQYWFWWSFEELLRRHPKPVTLLSTFAEKGAYTLPDFWRAASDIIEREPRSISVILGPIMKKRKIPLLFRDLPELIEQPSFRTKRSSSAVYGSTFVPLSAREHLSKLGITELSAQDIHNVIDKLANHRDEVISNLVKGLPESERAKRVEELNRIINFILPQLREYASQLSTKRVIRSFYLKQTPKDPEEWIQARIRASNDCTVPKGPAFAIHTIPTLLASNAANYEIRADHLDTRRNGRGVRLRKDRHVGNVYLAKYLTDDGKKILYIHGVQLGKIYRGKENTWIAKPLLKALVEEAGKNGFHEVWIQTRDLSNYGNLQKSLIAAFRKMGAEPATKEHIDRLNYLDLPKEHYASPHKVGHRNILRLELKPTKKEVK